MEDDLECYQKFGLNMEKTIEEIRPIVLAYCNAICKTMDDSVYWSEDQTVNIHGSDDTYIATCGGVVVPIRQSMQDRIWLAAYRLLGLETRDAVEESDKSSRQMMDEIIRAANDTINKKNKIAKRYRQSLGYERAKSAKWQSRAWRLLEIAKIQMTFYQEGDFERKAKQFVNLANYRREIAEKALLSPAPEKPEEKPEPPQPQPDENGLLPCPFCGDKAFLSYEDGSEKTCVTCGGCGTMSALFTDEDNAIEAWNRRA